ncbi:MAG: hypothetical protein AB1374_12465 [Bacillota bacterium]
MEQGKPRIKEVLAEFLKEQRRRLRPSTLRRYEEVVELFEGCLNNYGYQFLDEGESALYEKLSRETPALIFLAPEEFIRPPCRIRRTRSCASSSSLQPVLTGSP